MKCVKKLKNNESYEYDGIFILRESWNTCPVGMMEYLSCGYDGILNEFLKTFSKLLISIAVLFNIVLQTGKIPQAWSTGYTGPIYTGKG